MAASGVRSACRIRRGSGIGAAICVTAICAVAWLTVAEAQTPQPIAPFTSAEPPAPPQAQPQPSPGQALPPDTSGARPGFIDAFGRWVQESTANFNASIGRGWNAPAQDMSNAANNAARNTVDLAKGAAEATRGAAGAMTDAARETAGALSRLPNARVVTGRQRCTVAPNGAPDCRAAATAMCRTSGFASGASVEFETAEACPSDAMLARWRGETVKCAIENYVTRSLCQ